MMTDATPRLRADARRNRDRIIAAARTVLTERGTEVPMEEITRAAGVGIGTLYSRFPDRDSLLSAIGRDAFQRVLDEARTICDRESDPWRALTGFLLRAVDLHGGPAHGDPVFHALPPRQGDPGHGPGSRPGPQRTAGNPGRACTRRTGQRFAAPGRQQR
ncbi:TetR/AcrR family transcriptional regulator [Saccharopolyspora spinosa]|uniref:TetR/AcrR family transcriptional regulator n=1 Tax=Saccharopolyspora spinosa TaxID=60894 RepID=UPI00023794D7|nr:TetR/AcrR family transcriptional regulator [Saccharopolyspora spinosa]